MFTSKLNLLTPVVCLIVASMQPALALNQVPAPVIGAGLPVLAVLGGGFWLVRKVRKPR
jgi:lipopolysaccharide export LptBFGC system permease protein LptF